MTYLRVTWKHANPEYPVLLFSELDAQRFEVRKIDVYADGHSEFASRIESTGTCKLGLVQTPPIEEIAVDPQFDPLEIDETEFELMWKSRVGSVQM